MQTLQEALTKHTKQQKLKTEDVIQGLERLLHVVPYECEKERWQEAVDALMTLYFRLQLAEHYQLLSPELFDLKTTIELENITRQGTQYHNVKLTIPLFARLPFGKDEWTHQGSATGLYTIPKNQYDSGKDTGKEAQQKLSFEFSVPAPALTREVKQKQREAKAHVYEALAAAHKNPVVGEFISRALFAQYGSTTNDFLPTFSILWRPDPKELKHYITFPPDPDPALIMTSNKDHYLITTWDVPKEQPYEHFLKEYGITLEDNTTPSKEKHEETDPPDDDFSDIDL